jgi:hypothetical protein
MSTSRGGSIARWILIGGACVLMFLIPSALLLDLGLPRWAAGPLGALSFPILPIGWHLLAERARKRRVAAAKVAPKPGLTVGDRFVLRLVAVALVTCAPWIVLARGRTWHAVKDHAGWPVAWISFGGGGGERPPIDADRALLEFVPADAEGLIWIRGVADLTKVMRDDADAKAAPDDDGFQQGVFAIKHGELMIVVRATKLDPKKLDGLKDIDQEAAKKYFGHELHFVAHPISADTFVAVTEGWDAAYQDRAAKRAPTAKALIDRLAAGPADALIVGAVIPRGPIGGFTIRDAVLWFRVDVADKQLITETTVRGADAAGAAVFAAGAQHLIEAQKDRLTGRCKDTAGALLDGIHVTTKGDTVSIDTRVAPESLMAAAFCGLAAEPD